ncbi:MAG TPA: class II aldolase/adducin family protein [Lentisphaeria bacterium]|nr:class II aldolase/adducin family protein [Lentisphaerota bacterium]OQC15650.1 MAG: L-fuculose phosphate aldolase [Lentisphaerae bacterium ADurb.Bin082]HQC53285.1 class II aldolase/adducin family protein [Lentisphaeria bacterium]HQL86106.1 class II aldolase/adducin family protein [Lentisphaeria bacterium]
MTSLAERTQVAEYMRRLYARGLTTASGGNISCRTCSGNVAITASKLDKAALEPAGVGLVTPAGVNLTPELTLSIETAMHLAIYAQRPDVQAIVHAHPVFASAFSAAQASINTHLTAEAYAIVGDPAFIPYALMGSPDLANQVAAGLATASCGVLENHGVIALGAGLLEAFDRIELLENAARQTVILAQLGGVRELSPERLRQLDIFMGRA